MALLKDGAYAEDNWVSLADDEALTDEPCVVSLTRWQKDAETLRTRNAPLGLRLESSESPELIADDINQFDVIMLNFPAFKDGRAYSYARLLRSRLGFTGELRATGDVLRSQLQFMHRVGFDTFDVDTRITPEVYADEVAKIGEVYQPSVIDEDTVLDKRSRNRGR